MRGIFSVMAVLMTAGIASVYAGQPAVKDVLNKKNLKNAEQKINQKATQTAAAATAAAKELVKTDAGIPLVGDLSDADEQALGRETAGRMLAAYPLVKNDSVQRYVNLVGATVARQTPRAAAFLWTFGVIETDDINAFAMPGGYIVVTSGLYRTLKNEAELAAVLGHEIAHVNLRHHVRLMQKEMLLAKGSEYLAGKTKQAALKELAGAGATVAARSLDRQAEYECDRTGMEYAARAGYDPYAYLEVVDRLGAEQNTDRLALLYKTHPDPRARFDALAAAIGAGWNGVKGATPARWVVLP